MDAGSIDSFVLWRVHNMTASDFDNMAQDNFDLLKLTPKSIVLKSSQAVMNYDWKVQKDFEGAKGFDPPPGLDTRTHKLDIGRAVSSGRSTR